MLKEYKKHFLPLESNPDVFNELIHLLGAKDEIAFEDVLTLDEPELLPRPALAVVLVLPATPADDEKKAAMEAARPEYDGEDGEPVLWFEQRIHNACGLYAILHALCNVEPHRFLESGGVLSHFLHNCINERPLRRAQILEGDLPIERAYAAVAAKGDSAVPNSAEDEVYFHYICFVRSDEDKCLYELDGDRKGPVSLGKVDVGGHGDILTADTVSLIKKYIEQGEGNIGFSLMALVNRSAAQ